MNLVELELDETLADFEVQDWIDNVFSVQYPGVKARIKKGCSGLCHKKDEWHYVKDGDLPQVKTWVIGFYYEKDNWHKIFYRADGNWWGEGQLCQPPYAWKEIVLPELEENKE